MAGEMQNYQTGFQTTRWVFEEINRALQQKRGLSLIRIGDGETRTMAHHDLISIEEIPPWLRYAGVSLPDQKAKNGLIEAVRKAGIVGLPVEKDYYFQPLMLKLIKRHNFQLKYICSNRINYHLYVGGYLQQIISEKKVIIVGRKAAEALPYFQKTARVVGTYDLPDMRSLENTYLQILENPDYQLALVAAGIPAVILCPWLADLNKVAIDLGHVIDSIVTPDQDLFLLMDNWMKENIPESQ